MEQNQDAFNNQTTPPSLPPARDMRLPAPPSPPGMPPPPMPPGCYPPPAKPRRSILGILLTSALGGLLLLSLIVNVYLFMIVGMKMGYQQDPYRGGNKQAKIALIDLAGSISMKTAEEMRLQLKQAQEDNEIKGVILVVNSPGGQVVPSDMANHYLQEFRKSGKPVYVCIEQLGASGAYWISAASDRIYAQTNALIGSIGVIYMNLVVEEGLKQKLGITPVIIKSTRSPMKDHNTPFRMPTEAEIVDVRKDLDTIHQRFVDVVCQGRKLDPNDAWPLANGDVFDGPEALEKKLIDQIGFLDDVIGDLAKKLDIRDPMIVRLVRPRSLREIIMARDSQMPENPFNLSAQLEQWATTPRIQALWLGE